MTMIDAGTLSAHLHKQRMADAEILERAADLIETGGHCKGYLWELDEDGQSVAYCLAGGVYTAMGIGTDDAFWTANSTPREVNRIDRIFRRISTVKWGNPLRDPQDLISWNNADERTGAEVVDLLKETAKELRNVA